MKHLTGQELEKTRVLIEKTTDLSKLETAANIIELQVFNGQTAYQKELEALEKKYEWILVTEKLHKIAHDKIRGHNDYIDPLDNMSEEDLWNDNLAFSDEE